MNNDQGILKAWLIENEEERNAIYEVMKDTTLSDEKLYQFLAYTVRHKATNPEMRLRQFDWCIHIVAKIRNKEYKEKSLGKIRKLIKKSLLETTSNYHVFAQQLFSIRSNANYNIFILFKDIKPVVFKKFMDELMHDQYVRDFSVIFKDNCIRNDLYKSQKDVRNNSFNFGKLITHIDDQNFQKEYKYLSTNISYFMNKIPATTMEAIRFNDFFLKDINTELSKLSDENIEYLLHNVKKKTTVSFFDEMLTFWLFEKKQEFTEKHWQHSYMSYYTSGSLFQSLVSSNKHKALCEYLNTEHPFITDGCRIEDMLTNIEAVLQHNPTLQDIQERMNLFKAVYLKTFPLKRRLNFVPCNIQYSKENHFNENTELKKINYLMSLNEEGFNFTDMFPCILNYYAAQLKKENSQHAEELQSLLCKGVINYSHYSLCENDKFLDIISHHFDLFKEEEKIKIIKEMHETFISDFSNDIVSQNENIMAMKILIDKEFLNDKIHVLKNSSEKSLRL